MPVSGRLNHLLSLVMLGIAGVACEIKSTEPRDAGFGTVVIHMKDTNGGAAAGVVTYVTGDRGEFRLTTGIQGNAQFDSIPAGSWDVGYFEDNGWIVGVSGGTRRKAVDVENDRIVEETFVVKRVGVGPGQGIDASRCCSSR